MSINKNDHHGLSRTASSDCLNKRITTEGRKALKNSADMTHLQIFDFLNLENANKERDVKKLCDSTLTSLALSVYKIYLDLGSETLGILKSEGLKPDHKLLDIGPRFLTSCYISSYLNLKRYFTVAENETENNSLELCDTYVEYITGKNRYIDCLDMSIKEFCYSTHLNNSLFDFVLIQRNLAGFEDIELRELFYKIMNLISPHGKILAHYVENFPDKPGGCPIFIFKRVLGSLAGIGYNVRTLPYPFPINLRMLCITLKNKIKDYK